VGAHETAFKPAAAAHFNVVPAAHLLELVPAAHCTLLADVGLQLVPGTAHLQLVRLRLCSQPACALNR
jgi:hypothetical protein